ncbi:hypothetical protein [Amycolatopsis sp.]|uniref:hypothetical protein n=1 Tax=Amycolatopsis sp. TaxID=37632 RepID=UPI002C748886|nr:hypothetical protein [Amycolatopsis sp.]HVV08565.1 hypothetical protein [Amycolatopsis sp.]
MLGHLGLSLADLTTAKACYDELMPLVGFERFLAAEDQFAYRPADGKPGTYLFCYQAREAAAHSRHQPGLQHLALMVNTRSAVHAVHDRARDLGRRSSVRRGSSPSTRRRTSPVLASTRTASCWRPSATTTTSRHFAKVA